MAKTKITNAKQRDTLIAPLKTEQDLQEFAKKYSFAPGIKEPTRKNLLGKYTQEVIDKYLAIKHRTKAEKPTVTYKSIRKDILTLAGAITPEQKEVIESKFSEIESYIKGIEKEAFLRREIAVAEDMAKDAIATARKKEKALAEHLASKSKAPAAPKKEQKKK